MATPGRSDDHVLRAAAAVRLREPQDGDAGARAAPGSTRATPRRKLTNNALKKGDTAAYNGDLARVFHQWMKLCTFTPTQAGNYYLQVRTNVAWKGPTLTTLANYNA